MDSFTAAEALKKLVDRVTEGDKRTIKTNNAMIKGYEAMCWYGECARITARDLTVMRYIAENPCAIIVGDERNVKNALRAAIFALSAY